MAKYCTPMKDTSSSAWVAVVGSESTSECPTADGRERRFLAEFCPMANVPYSAFADVRVLTLIGQLTAAYRSPAEAPRRTTATEFNGCVFST
jgi:hypothetical protein